MKKLFPILLVVLVLIVYVRSHPTHVSPISVSKTATSTKTGPQSYYPNPSITPGDILTADAAVVCVSGYSSKVRNVPVSEKREVYLAYNTPYPAPQGSYEADHFISLELGGSNDIKNLWPEPALPTPGFHEKDAVENYLHGEVCSGKISLAEAQREISTDWYAVYLRIE